MESKAQETTLLKKSGTFAALQHRNFQLYFGGQLVSNAGTWMQVIAQGWLVYQISHSELALGIVGFASAIPTLLVSPWGGVIVDRVPKRTLLVWTQASAMLLAFILAGLTFAGIVQEWHIILLAAGIGVVNSFDGPARQAFVVEMVGREDLPNAIAVNSMMINIARVIGPALGGFLLAFLGASWCFTINGFSYLAVIISLLVMELKPHVAPVRLDSPFSELAGGLKYVANQPELKGLLLLSLIFSVFGISYSTILPAFVERVLNQDAVIYGWINAMIGIGATLGAFMIASYHGENWRGSWLLISSIGFPIVLTLFAFTQYVPLSLALSIGLGMGFMVQFTMINTLLQTRVDDRLRGRVMGLYTLTFFGFSPFGNLIVGILSEHIGLSVSVMIFAALSLILSLIIFQKTPQIKRLP
ncbi:MAG: MFS transporter [Anaerolineales bacterium]|nr:MFS transporter [Anaerolineales bacterium]MCZ2121041.1 MFS transporter [Anaerolineales bacterium]